jgi:hypothetical protein
MCYQYKISFSLSIFYNNEEGLVENDSIINNAYNLAKLVM